MGRILLGGVALIALIGAAKAADLPARVSAPPPVVAPVAVPYTWTGFYVGGGFGYGLWDIDTSLVPPAGILGETNNGGRGWIGQVVAGFDYQFAIAGFNLVAGVFGDYDFGQITGTLNAGAGAAFATLNGIEKERSYWAAGGRIGWLVTPQILSYWNAGYTEARFNGINLTGFAAPMSTAANTYNGWFTGGGVETKVSFLPGLFFNTEYRYSSYNNATLPISNSVAGFGVPVSLKLEPHVQTVMSGLRYKFNWTP